MSPTITNILQEMLALFTELLLVPKTVKHPLKIITCVYTNRREVRCGTHMLSLGQALKGSVLGYPEHSNWQRGFWQCSNFTGFTHPTTQTNKQTNKHSSHRGVLQPASRPTLVVAYH
jgi:hypothetical protein